jgi:hypothetical protein
VSAPSDDDKERKIEARGRYASSLAGASITQALLLLESFPALAAVAGAAASPALANAVSVIVQRRKERVAMAADAACAEGSCEFDDIVNATVSSDRKIELLGRALDSAALAEDARKVRALGVALARGVLGQDNAKLDEQMHIVNALSRIGPAEAKLLDYMVTAGRSTYIVRLPEIKNQNKSPTLESELPFMHPLLDAVVASLSTLGLISNEGYGISTTTSWHVTEFGYLCLNALLEQGD